MRRIVALCAGIAAMTTIISCDIGTVTVPPTAPSVVVQAVLNASSATQIVLLERTLTGAVTLHDTVPLNALDPIVSAGGIPISGATVDIIDSTGKVTHGVEDATINPRHVGQGVYRFQIPGPSLVLGAVYRLRIVTPTGEQVTASTRIPRPTTRSFGDLTRPFNRDHDVVIAQWSAVPGASSYLVRVETPFAPFMAFTDSTHFQLGGQLRNLFASDLPRVFQPGFRQDILVAAVDSNFYDYYRTGNDPFTGAGLINRVQGGIGLFGSLVSISSGTFNVTADQTPPIEGRYTLLSPTGQTIAPLASQLVLYIESAAARAGLPDAITGRYTAFNSSRTDGMIGNRIGNTLTLALLQDQAAGDTVDLLIGQLHGDTLVASARSTAAPVLYLRSP